jgi:hypothetical protein
MPIVERPDPDFQSTERQSITMPVSWWARVDAVGKARGADRFSVLIQLTRHSLDMGSAPETPPSSELKGTKKTNSVYLAGRRWTQLQEEMERRGLSLNKVFQSHLLRALAAEESDIASERKPKR